MFFSVFTPVARTDFLYEAYRSLLLQKGPDWEWVLGLTGHLVEDNIPSVIRQDARVRIEHCPAPHPDKVPGIGMAKRHLCASCRGDVFVELDHDDMLLPGLLRRVQECVEAGAGFVYSDAAVFVHGKEPAPKTYNKAYGWESYPFRCFGRPLVASRAFDVSARSLADISFSPDHVRCWTKQAYFRAGGHDPDLPVGDDHDLMCRTYLVGVPMVHTGTVGYLYRWHGSNATRKFNKKIRTQQDWNSRRYLRSMIDEWCRREGLERLILRGHDGAKKIWDLFKKKPGTFGLVDLDEVLERLEWPHALKIWDRAHELLSPGGWFLVRAVSTNSRWCELPHCRSHWNDLVIGQLCSPAYHKTQLKFFGLAPEFQPVSIKEERVRGIDLGADHVPYIRVSAELSALKGQRQPGLLPV